METAIALFFSDLRERTPNLTPAIEYLANSYVLKGGVLIALLFLSAAPFRQKFFSSKNLHIVRSGAAIFISMFAARVLQLTLPHRARPYFITEKEYAEASYAGMNSFPSDHAVLMTCIAVAIFMRNRTIGVIALGWTLLFILMPRIYLGWHHPTDILAGMALGGGICWAVMRTPAPPGLQATVQKLEINYAAPLYLLTFLFAVETARNFKDARAAAGILLDMI